MYVMLTKWACKVVVFETDTDIITWFLLKSSEITAENNKRQFFLNEC